MASTHFTTDDTHDPKLESWVESANDPKTDFPIQNLPFCSFEVPALDSGPLLGTRIGDAFLRFDVLEEAGLLHCEEAVLAFDLGAVEHLSGEARRDLRARLNELLSKDNAELRDNDLVRAHALIDARHVETLLPDHQVLDYTDFYASLHHATNVGSMFRPDNPILPNYKWIPIGYHGRASSIVNSGAPVRRPKGQLLPGATIDDGPPQYGPCKLLDYELEVGFFVGQGTEMGETLSVDEAEERVFGVCLVNDWSARDIQKWEYQPLGPFLAKSFATTLSPYVVTMEALAPFRAPAFKRASGDPQPLAHLTSDANEKRGGLTMTVEAYLATKQMRDKGMDPVRLSRGDFADMYWTPAQMLAHHASNGCNMSPGDLFASGTVSGPKRDNRGCLLELTWDGDPFADPPVKASTKDRTPIRLPTGEERKFLADGDEVILKAYCERDGFRRIGFGECRGIVLPAVE